MAGATEGVVGLPRMRGQAILVGEHDRSRFEFPFMVEEALISPPSEGQTRMNRPRGPGGLIQRTDP